MPQTEAQRRAKKQWAANNRASVNAKGKRWADKHKNEKAAYNRTPEAIARRARYTEQHPEQALILRRSKDRVRSAVRSGRLIRPEHCEQCGVACRPDAAHDDYSRPLDVRWMCRSCHRTWDMNQPKLFGKREAK